VAALQVMVVTVTATTTSGGPLSPDLLAKVVAGCDMALQLEADKAQVRRRQMVGVWCVIGREGLSRGGREGLTGGVTPWPTILMCLRLCVVAGV